MKLQIVLTLSDTEIEFLEKHGIDVLCHCCGQDGSTDETNIKIQKKLCESIKEALEADNSEVA